LLLLQLIVIIKQILINKEKMDNNNKRGKLYVVSTHIGNIEDVTRRAVEVLKLSDLIVCEELKVGSVLLKELQINKKLETLNEQNEEEKVFELIKLIQEDDKKLALISDCGTPVFADPGYSLVRNSIIAGVNVIVVPGVTSLMTALVRSGLSLDQFLYAGFLSRKREERIDELLVLSKETRTVAVYDTPYRLIPLLEDAAKIMPHRKCYIGMNLTMPYETHHYGTFSELYNKFKEERIKAEFVICFEGASSQENERKFSRRRSDLFEEEFGGGEQPYFEKRSNNRSNTPLDRARNWGKNPPQKSRWGDKDNERPRNNFRQDDDRKFSRRSSDSFAGKSDRQSDDRRNSSFSREKKWDKKPESRSWGDRNNERPRNNSRHKPDNRNFRERNR
jgi:16S rRNA (cytidine1402-2'-O)-methyltransferase